MGPMDKFITTGKTSSVKITAGDQVKFRDELTKWICSSIRPFNLVADPGFASVLQKIVDICQRYQGSIDIENILVTPRTISNNVHRLAAEYRNSIQPILVEQAESGTLTICPDLWNDPYRKVDYLGLTAYFVNAEYELHVLDLCCSPYREINKTGESVLRAIRKQLDLFGLLSFMDNHKIAFTSDRGPNILKALKGQPVLFCFAHRLNNILKLAFYQTAQKREKKLSANSTTPSKTPFNKNESIDMSSSEESICEDDPSTPSPSKYIEANTLLSSLPLKPKDILSTSTTSKKLVKYVKLVGLNKSIEELGGVALKQECVVRWLSLSNMLQSVDASMEQLRSILSSKSFKAGSLLRLNNINTDALKDVICLLNEFKNVSLLVQTGTRPLLHMAYVGINKLEHHLNGTDVDQNGEIITIDDRHEGTEVFRKRLVQLLRCKFAFDDRHIAVAVLHPLYRRLTFATSYSKNIAHMFIREQLDEILGISNQQARHKANGEPAKKKHKSMEDQFADPDIGDSPYDVNLSSPVTSRIDELDRYLRLEIDDVYKQSNPLPFWREHQQKFPALSLLARRLFSIPVTSPAVERQFSSAGLTINECRSSLDPDTLNDILFIKSIQNVLRTKPNLFSNS